MLDSITVKGFKSIASIQDLKLGPINVFIGPNGSGKSNFIGVFSFLNAIRSGRIQEFVLRSGGADRILHFGSRTTKHLSVNVSFQNRDFQYRIQMAATETDSLYRLEERVSDGRISIFESSNGRGTLGKSETFFGDPNEDELIRHAQNALDGWRVHHFYDAGSTSPMRKTTNVNDNRYLRPDASNLAAFLFLLRLKHENEYDLIRRTVKLVAPFFDDFLLQPLALNEETIRMEWRHKGTDAYFDGASFSDGTLRFIALATLLLQPEPLRPPTVIIDEPELGLHPYAITLFASLAKQASVNTQIILATQSSLLLDHFQPEDVLVADRVDGQTQFSRLDADSLKNWLNDYSLGQLWEKNEIGGRPSHE